MNIKHTFALAVIAVLSSASYAWNSPEVALVLEQNTNGGQSTVARYDGNSLNYLGDFNVGNNQVTAMALTSNSTVAILSQGAFNPEIDTWDFNTGELLSSEFLTGGLSYFNSMAWLGSGYFALGNSTSNTLEFYNPAGQKVNYGDGPGPVTALYGSGDGSFKLGDGTGAVYKFTYNNANNTWNNSFYQTVSNVAISGVAQNSTGDITYTSGSNFGLVDADTSLLYRAISGTATYIAPGHGDSNLGILASGSQMYISRWNCKDGFVPDLQAYTQLGDQTSTVKGFAVYAAPEPDSWILLSLAAAAVLLKRRTA